MKLELKIILFGYVRLVSQRCLSDTDIYDVRLFHGNFVRCVMLDAFLQFSVKHNSHKYSSEAQNIFFCLHCVICLPLHGNKLLYRKKDGG
jgi:hypothetical protein